MGRSFGLPRPKPGSTRIGAGQTRTSGLPGGRHESAEPFGQSRALRLIGPRGGVSEPGEEDRCNTRDPAKPHRDHQSSPRRGHRDGPPEHGARQLQDGDRGKDDRHDQGVTLRVHDLLALNSSVPGVRNWWLPVCHSVGAIAPQRLSLPPSLPRAGTSAARSLPRQVPIP